MKTISKLLLLFALLLTACGGSAESSPTNDASISQETPASTENQADQEVATDDDAAVANTVGQTSANETTERSETQFTVSGTHTIDTPRAIAVANALPDTDTVALQIKTAVSGSRAPAIIFLENVSSTPGEYTLSRLSLDDPQPGVLEAGIDILDEEKGGVYPYVQFGENSNGTLTITEITNNQMSGTFSFTAESGDGTAVSVSGSFTNVTLP